MALRTLTSGRPSICRPLPTHEADRHGTLRVIRSTRGIRMREHRKTNYASIWGATHQFLMDRNAARPREPVSYRLHSVLPGELRTGPHNER